MFGFDLEKMLGGEGGGGGNMIMNLITKQLASPKIQKMIADKTEEIFDFLAAGVKADKDKVALLVKMENVPAKDETGNLLMEPGKEGVPAVQKLERKAIIYVMVDGKAVQKIAFDQFLAMMQQQQGG